MLSNVVSAAFLLGIFFMMFVTPAVFAKGVFLIDHGELDNSDKVKMWIPIYNVVKAESMYTGRVSFVGIGILVLFITTVIRVLAATFAEAYVVHILTIILFLLGIVFYYAVNVYIVFVVINDSDTKGLLGKVIYSLIFPLGQYFIGNFLPNEMKHLAKEESVFK